MPTKKRPTRAAEPKTKKRASVKPEPLSYPTGHRFPPPRQTPLVRMPMAGQDVLVRTEEDGLGGVPVQVARVLTVEKPNQLRVTYHGWSNDWDETVTLERLLHWDTAANKALAAEHVAEIEAVAEAAAQTAGAA